MRPRRAKRRRLYLGTYYELLNFSMYHLVHSLLEACRRVQPQWGHLCGWPEHNYSTVDYGHLSNGVSCIKRLVERLRRETLERVRLTG